MKNFKYLSVVLVGLLLASCGPTVKVTSDYDHSVDYKKYKTFGIYKTESQKQPINELNRDRIIMAVKNELTKKGLTESDSADLKVNIITILKVMPQVSATTSIDNYGYGGFYRPYMWGGPTTATTNFDIDTYKDGSLIIDLIDAKTGKLVWQGVGNSEIYNQPGSPDEAIGDAVTKIMAQYPPAAKK